MENTDKPQIPIRKNEDRRQQPRSHSKDRRNEAPSYPIDPEYSDEIEIVEDKSLGTSSPLSKVIEEREDRAFQKGELNYTPFKTDEVDIEAQNPLDIEKLKQSLRQEITAELTQSEPQTPIEEAVEIKPFVKKRKPGRPSSLPKESESNEWPRKTYRFNKHTLRQLKIYQASLEEHQDLSLIINTALSQWLDEQDLSI